MLLIAAALTEELRVALDLCSRPAKVLFGTSRLWQGTYRGTTIHFLKTGVGPFRAGDRLQRLLTAFRPTQILVIGYAGALDPSLKPGDLVIGSKACIFGIKPDKKLPIERLELSGCWEMAHDIEMAHLARAAGLGIQCGTILTSPHIIGAPQQKRILHLRFQAVAIDMETAALAQVACAAGIPVSCARAVSDASEDEFLAPFSYDPQSNLMVQAAKAVAAGNWIRRCREWRRRAGLARASLGTFLEDYYQNLSA